MVTATRLGKPYCVEIGNGRSVVRSDTHKAAKAATPACGRTSCSKVRWRPASACRSNWQRNARA